jgi:hypothetical protein
VTNTTTTAVATHLLLLQPGDKSVVLALLVVHVQTVLQKQSAGGEGTYRRSTRGRLSWLSSNCMTFQLQPKSRELRAGAAPTNLAASCLETEEMWGPSLTCWAVRRDWVAFDGRQCGNLQLLLQHHLSFDGKGLVLSCLEGF